MAVGFIVIAAIRIRHKVVTNRLTATIGIGSVLLTYFIRAPWIFPLVMILSGVLSVWTSGESQLWNKVSLRPKWRWLVAFVGFAVTSYGMMQVTNSVLIALFEKFYRYGYLVFGGGQVVVPMMYTELVEVAGYMSGQEFLTGYGLVQGVPGPMFSFSAYVGGMAARGFGPLVQIAGAVISDIGIFLPGILLIYFVYPLWEDLKGIRGIKISLSGVSAAAAGMIAAAALRLLVQSGIHIETLIVVLITTILLWTKKVPAPLIVVLTLVVGFLT